MAETRRKMAAIMSADVVGYSRLMGDDESATVETLAKYKNIFADYISRHDGRVVDSPGDNLLADFASPVEALAAAVDIQKEIGYRNRQLAEHRQMQFRIGLNLGDVIAKDDGTLYGDGINIAARIEGLASAGGICISKLVFDSVEGKLDLGFEFMGEQQVKNIPKPINVYRVVTDPEVKVKQSEEGSKRSRRSSKLGVAAVLVLMIAGVAVWQAMLPIVSPSNQNVKTESLNTLVVIPIETLGEEESSQQFAAGLTHDLGNALSRMAKGLNVIVLPERPNKIEAIADSLNAQYVLDGNFRQSNNALRFTIKLIDAKSHTNIWTDTIDGTMGISNVFAIQDDIVNSVVDELVGSGAVLAKEVNKQAKAKGTDSLTAYECVNFMKHVTLVTLLPNDYVKAKTCLEKAVKIDPSYAEAWKLLAMNSSDQYAFGYTEDKQFLLDGIDHISQAIRLDPHSGHTLAIESLLQFYLKNWDAMVRATEKAIELEPNNYVVLGLVGQMLAFGGTCSDNDIKEKVSSACYWEKGWEYSLKAHQLDRANTDVIENYTLAAFYLLWGEYQLAMDQLMQVPSPGFYWWDMYAGVAADRLGNTAEAQKRIDSVSATFGTKELTTLKPVFVLYNLNNTLWPSFKGVLVKYGWQ